LTRFELEGKLVITQATQTIIGTSKKEMVNEYVLKLRTHNSSNFVTQYILNEEIMMEFELFKRYLIQCCQRILKEIKEANEWKVTNGYTI
jgi:glycerol-3-phosphate cytidylyltransferase-like family protein